MVYPSKLLYVLSAACTLLLLIIIAVGYQGNRYLQINSFDLLDLPKLIHISQDCLQRMGITLDGPTSVTVYLRDKNGRLHPYRANITLINTANNNRDYFFCEISQESADKLLFKRQPHYFFENPVGIGISRLVKAIGAEDHAQLFAVKPIDLDSEIIPAARVLQTVEEQSGQSLRKQYPGGEVQISLVSGNQWQVDYVLPGRARPAVFHVDASGNVSLPDE